MKSESKTLTKRNLSLKSEQEKLEKVNQELHSENTTLYERVLLLTDAVKKKQKEMIALSARAQGLENSTRHLEEQNSQRRRFEELLYKMQHDTFIRDFLKRLGVKKFKAPDGSIYEKTCLDLYQEALNKRTEAYRREAKWVLEDVETEYYKNPIDRIL